jgi:hypothetical protein
MDGDDSPVARCSVSSLKSRFEQLATQETKNGPDDAARPSSTQSSRGPPSSSDKGRESVEEPRITNNDHNIDGRSLSCHPAHTPCPRPLRSTAHSAEAKNKAAFGSPRTAKELCPAKNTSCPPETRREKGRVVPPSSPHHN